MRLPPHPTLIRRRLDSRIKRCCPAGPLLAASLAAARRRCGDPSRHCAKGGPRHVTHPLTLKEQGKTRTVCVPKELLPEVRAGIDEHKRHKRRLQGITPLTLALIHSHVPHRRRKRGRL
jgi:hypothetical protein